MKIYDFKLAPNPRRVRIFLAEKGISVPFEEVDIFKGVNRQPEFLKKNSLGGIPVLVSALADSRMPASSRNSSRVDPQCGFFFSLLISSFPSFAFAPGRSRPVAFSGSS